MTTISKAIFTTFLLGIYGFAFTQTLRQYNAIYSSVPWLDNSGNAVSAHGGCLVKDNSKFYFFGEKHSDTSNAFAGFNCYSSTDLYNWTFENTVLPVQASGKLGANRVGERVKVMRCPKTGEYIMLMHVDTLRYRDQYIGYATCSTINGIYTFKGPLLYNGKPIKKWDMGTFQDKDGSGYLLLHGGDIYKLSDDYKTAAEQVLKNMSPESESPAVFKKDSLYYWLASHRTSWERNDNFYYTATSLKGPWTAQGTFTPTNSLTWNSQTTFVLPIEGDKHTTYLFMGDRWAFPKQASAATYVWQPLTVNGASLSISTFNEAFTINIKTGTSTTATIGTTIILPTDKKRIVYTDKWQQTATESRSNVKDASFLVKFKGTQIAWYSMAKPDGGYAQVTLIDSKGKTLLRAIVDMYCKNEIPQLQFISPILAKDNYVLTVSALGERGNWTDSKKAFFGSIGNYISLTKLVVKD